ncbi:hotdog family protein [Mycobacterium noviomagense]|uniref:Thioesterase n=1 Tax=Mycobacterium noviomagense TaxID=459858 RepID=A0A7I7P7Y0_9MYCO|nr:hypothetical protein [Mycobacterium noviomagense]ORB18635.1 hypothetical protein BST37_00180 [Mycobacterium noviomagense]BBY04983.1 hypothetical protein MNVI_03010 [Mycobacterium noviomagense]
MPEEIPATSTDGGPDSGAARFGEQPLAQTVAAARAIRRISSLLLSLEHPHPTVDVMLTKFAEWERELAAAAPPDNAPRIGPDDNGVRRVYLDHAADIGAFNPCFPEYLFDHLDAERARGRVTFPLVYEGPPGLVHGGFLGVFFDCVIQQHNCAAMLSGKTRSLQLTFRRPTPILTELQFDIARTEVDGGIESTARLLHDGELLSIGKSNTLAMSPDKLAGSRFGKRRPEKS